MRNTTTGAATKPAHLGTRLLTGETTANKESRKVVATMRRKAAAMPVRTLKPSNSFAAYHKKGKAGTQALESGSLKVVGVSTDSVLVGVYADENL